MIDTGIHMGADVSKKQHDFFAVRAQRAEAVANRISGIWWIVELARRNGWSGRCESTAIYGRILLEACHSAGVTIAVANPLRVRRYA